jgi:hypothetical protein
MDSSRQLNLFEATGSQVQMQQITYCSTGGYPLTRRDDEKTGERSPESERESPLPAPLLFKTFGGERQNRLDD